jgi:hypothetical protein
MKLNWRKRCECGKPAVRLGYCEDTWELLPLFVVIVSVLVVAFCVISRWL